MTYHQEGNRKNDETLHLERLKQAVVAGEEEAARQATHEAIAAGVNPQKATLEGLSAGLAEMGRLYEAGECFVPEMMVSSEALYAGLEILRPLVLESADAREKRNCGHRRCAG